jgi:hypothetical protein
VLNSKDPGHGNWLETSTDCSPFCPSPHVALHWSFLGLNFSLCQKRMTLSFSPNQRQPILKHLI